MFKSNAQKRKMEELVKAGKITQAEFNRHLIETGTKKLPEHVADLNHKKIKAK